MKPRKIYMIGINLNGVWSERPMVGYWDKDLNCWYDTSGNFDVCQLGVIVKDRQITFASKNKKDVENFILGIRALGTLIHNLAWTKLPVGV